MRLHALSRLAATASRRQLLCTPTAALSTLSHSASSSSSNQSTYLAPTLLASAAVVAAVAHNQSHADANVAVSHAAVPPSADAPSSVAPKPPATPAAAPAAAPASPPGAVPEPEEQHIVNWSATHEVTTREYYQPQSLDELKAIVAHAHEQRKSLRPVGSALSPNGLSFSGGGMVNLCDMDKIVDIDKTRSRVTVQAGMRVVDLVEALRPHGLTLANYASIAEQQVAGLTQVSAHGSGVTIPTLDEAVVALRLVTPAVGELALAADDDDPSLFRVARASMGLLGVVAELTLQCVPAHKLVECTVVLSHDEVLKQHDKLLRDNRHVRYMWYPHTDAVIVVTCNPAADGHVAKVPKSSETERLQPMRDLLLGHPECKLGEEDVRGLNMQGLRDELLRFGALDVAWVKRINEAEAEFWRRSAGERVDWSDRILQFDCGGQQWVSEICFAVRPRVGTSTDLLYMQNVLGLIEREDVAAHAPIEQRWTAASSSPMSPAAERPDVEPAEVYSWVGIIMYMPDAAVDQAGRDKVTAAFKQYKHLCEYQLWPDVGAAEHWAKIEMPDNIADRMLLQVRTRRKYPVEGFNAICDLFDPHGILRNDLVDVIFNTANKRYKVSTTDYHEQHQHDHHDHHHHDHHHHGHHGHHHHH